MKTPRLNAKIYIKLNEGAQNKDRAAQAKQRDAAKASVPILEAMVALKKSEDGFRKSKNQEALKAIKDTSPMLQKLLKVLNYTFSEGMRKRKSDVCTSLGSQFKPFIGAKSSEDMLFEDDALKKMKSELKLLKSRSDRKPFTYGGYSGAASKNFKGSYKSQRSFPQLQGYRNKYPAKNNSFGNNPSNSQRGKQRKFQK